MKKRMDYGNTAQILRIQGLEQECLLIRSTKLAREKLNADVEDIPLVYGKTEDDIERNKKDGVDVVGAIDDIAAVETNLGVFEGGLASSPLWHYAKCWQ